MYFLNLDNIPILDIGNRQGSTDYIDFIRDHELTSPIMRGVDIFKRRFIILRMFINGKKFTQTFFQRYSNNEKLWMGDCNHINGLLDTCGGMKEIQFKLIQDIIDNKTIKLQKEHQLFNENHIDKFVCNEKVYLENKKREQLLQETNDIGFFNSIITNCSIM